MPDYESYQLKVSILTPMHIGSGVDLLHEYDYAIHKGYTWRINESTLLEDQDIDDPKLAETLAGTPPARLLKESDFSPDSHYFRYVIKGTPRSTAEGAQLREQLKDTFDRPYLPGSSLKGALRTALAWYAWGQLGLKPQINQLGRSRQRAGQDYESQIFGPDPQKDLLKALQISDSQPVDADRVMILNVRVLNQGGSTGSPIEVEAIRPDTEFAHDLKLDEALFSEWAKKHASSLRGEEWLRNIPEAVNQHARARIQQESRWYENNPAGNRPMTFYRQLEKAQPGPGQFLIQLGWGTGWGDKTFGTRLSEDPVFMEQMINKYHLARGKRKTGDPFPKSRRVAVSFSQSRDGRQHEVPASPLGWVLVEMKPK